MQRAGGGWAYIRGMNGHSHATFALVPELSRPPGEHPPGKPIPASGTWKYQVTRRSLSLFWTAMAISAAFHAGVFFGIRHHPPPPKPVFVDDSIAVNLVMPELKELEEPDRTSDQDEPPAEEGLSVPTLADVPTQVDLSQAFVQQIDYSTLVPKQDLSATATISIPTHISRGTKLGEGMGKIFDLKDLDRAPEPLVKIPPTVPPGLRQAGAHAEISVLFIVDATGVVRAPEIMRSSDRRFDDTALIAIAKWKFRPGVKNGRRVNVRMMQPMIFDVRESD